MFTIPKAIQKRITIEQMSSDPIEAKKHPKYLNTSRIRDHLANERTYLAWMRTAIALMGFGVLIARFRLLQPANVPTSGNGWRLGLIFSLVGLMTVLFSTRHYFGVRHDIDHDTYEPNDRWVMLFSLATVLIASGILYYVFTLPSIPLGNAFME